MGINAPTAHIHVRVLKEANICYRTATKGVHTKATAVRTSDWSDHGVEFFLRERSFVA